MAHKQNEKSTKQSVVGPLSFSNKCGKSIQDQLYPRSTQVLCLFCDTSFNFYEEKQDYLTHLYLSHRLIIGDEDQVAIFHEYLIHWRGIFNGDDSKMATFCTTILMDQLPDGTPSKNEQYFLLCDVSPQDYELRHNLQEKRLELALAQHQYERTDTQFKRNCLFCRDMITGTRSEFVEHLFSKHFLQLGRPENLVFLEELIDTVQLKLDELICLFCEKKFKDRPTLKEHMRKKGHKRINPDNKNYDKFFLVYYQNQQQRYQKQSKTREKKKHTSEERLKENMANILDGDSDSNWSDWEGDELDVTCLYCRQKNKDFKQVKEHMRSEHEIDFDQETNSMTFYDRVKIVNFVRRKMYTLECISCDERFETCEELENHLNQKKHCSLGNSKDWNLPQYFFPTYEDDSFLCHLDDCNIDDECFTQSNDVIVYSEDTTVAINLDAEALSKEQLKSL